MVLVDDWREGLIMLADLQKVVFDLRLVFDLGDLNCLLF